MGGTLANFSSYGPTLDDRLKPNVSAPGVNVESSLSSFRDGGYSITNSMEFNGTEYEFARISGTSMSSPATAGVIALMLEANPELTPIDVRSILETTAREDDHTGELPPAGDHIWGYGKVTASQAVLAALTWDSSFGIVDFEDEQLVVYPNPSHERIWFSEELIGLSDWEIYDIHGRLCRSGINLKFNSIEVSELKNGLYLLIVRIGDELQNFRFIKE